MGTFIGHFVPGIAFTLLGLWHTLNTTTTTTTTKSHNLAYSTPTWFPSPKIKHLELYLILIFSSLVAALQLSGGGHHLLLALSDLEHSTIFLHLAIYTVTAILSDRSPNPESLSPLVGLLAASAFGQELFLIHFHSAEHSGLEGHYHWLLQLLVAACCVSTLLSLGGVMPSAAVVRSAAVTCQGVWFVVMGFVLWVPQAVPEGCFPAGADGRRGSVECGTEEAERRAVAMANLQFSWMVAGVLVVVVCVGFWGEWRWREYRQLGVNFCSQHVCSQQSQRDPSRPFCVMNDSDDNLLTANIRPVMGPPVM